jgi:F0F1-type ATP synthase gamma subunit
METKNKSKDGRVGISLSPVAANKLAQLKESMAEKLGFEPSATQVVEYLITKYVKESEHE